MKQKEHLPIFGIGPVYIGTIAGLAAFGIFLSRKGYLDSGLIPALKTPMLIIGLLLALLGLFIWGYAIFRSRIDDGILHNHLVTDGIYVWMRNPLYTGWMFVIIGIVLCFGNLWLLVLPFIFWAHGREVAARALRRRIRCLLPARQPHLALVPQDGER